VRVLPTDTDFPAQASQEPAPGAGWQARLSCEFDKGPEKTIVRRTHEGPLRIQRPFYPEGDLAHVYLLHPPSGVVGGDGLHMNMQVNRGASSLVTTPGATKFYRSNGQLAHVSQHLSCEDGHFEWFPQENIYFNESRVEMDTDVYLSKAGSLAFWEIHCFGRTAGSQPFVSGSVTTKLSVYRDKQLLLMDRFVAEGEQCLRRATGLRGNTVSGLLLLTPLNSDCIESSRKLVEHEPNFTLSAFDGMLLVRYLGDSAEQAKAGFSQLWTHLRMALCQRLGCLPRIWAT